MATLEETLRSLGLSAARGIPQLATGFVDLAALPFTATGMLKPEQAVGSTAYLTSKGLLPPEQQGLLNQTTELVSSAMNPAGAAKTVGLLGATRASREAMDAIRRMSTERIPTDLSWVNNPIADNPSRIANAPSLDQVMQNAKNSNVNLDIAEKNGVINLSRIVVPKEQRGTGVGSGIMKQLVDYADATGSKITLTPSTDFGATSVSRLKDFYKQFGFVENKGRNKDFSTRETMYRESVK
jgi:predicted GNAT family acetyltransferase